MPSTLSYPGVYIEELPSGVHPITGVPTSITAFVGRTARGPVGAATTINSFADYERVFGGLALESPLSFAVRDFFLNGGGQAIVVRLYRKKDSTKDKAEWEATKAGDAGKFKLIASSEGRWGSYLRSRIETVKVNGEPSLFRLLVFDTAAQVLESFLVSSTTGHKRELKKVLEQESSLVRLSGAMPSATPEQHADPAAGKSVWADDNASSKVKDADVSSDGDPLTNDQFLPAQGQANKAGIFALEQADLFNLLSIPTLTGTASTDQTLLDTAIAYCAQRRAMMLIDPPGTWTSVAAAKGGIETDVGSPSKNAAVFFPRLVESNPLRDGQSEEFAPSGAVAGIFARTDAQRGVWKAPAGLDAGLLGTVGLAVPINDKENGDLNPLGINCLRTMPAAGRVVWGARTRDGADRRASEWKYIPVRRTALFIEESLYRGTQWVVFEPNDEPLWAQIRLNVGAFMQGLFRQGAFQGTTPQQAYFVKCDKETTTQDDINKGIVNIVVGFAPLKPAEFVVIRLQQMAGQIPT